MSQFCQGCKSVREIVYTDDADRGFCAACTALQPEPRTAALMSFLAATVPYEIGDKVSCKVAGQVYAGIGHVIEVSFDPADLASPVVPMFKVEMEEKAFPECPDEVWYSEICMSPVEVDA